MSESVEDTRGAERGRDSRGFLWAALVLVGAALAYEFLWLARESFTDTAAVFAVRRLGVRLVVPRGVFEAFAVVSAAAAAGCVVWVFLAARRALAAQACPPASGSAGRLALAGALLLVHAVPFYMAIGWADGRLQEMAYYGSEWYRKAFFRELGLVAAGRLLWLGALLALGAWLLRRPPSRWDALVSRALEAVSRAPRGLLVGLACALVMGVALALSLGLLRGEPHYNDANGYFFQAKTLAAGRLWSPLLGGREFFDPKLCPHPQYLAFAFVGDRWFFAGLAFGPVLYALGLGLGVPWLVSPLLGGATVVLTYVLARDCFGPTAGLLALPLCALSGWLILNSVEYLTHLPCLVPMLVFLIALRRALRHASWRWAAGAGLALGLAANARPVTAGSLCLPFAVLWLVWLARSPRAAWRPTLAFAAALAVPFAGMLAYNAGTTGDPLTFGYQLGWSPTLPGWHWRPVVGVANVLQSLYLFSAALLYWPIPAGGAILAAAALLGVWRGTDGSRWPLLLALAALVLALVYGRFTHVSVGMGGPRFVFEALPLIVVLAAGALVALCGRLVRAGVSPQRARAVLAALLAWCFACGAGFTIAQEAPQLKNLHSVDLRMFDTIRATARTPAVVFVPVPESSQFTNKFAAAIARNAPGLDGPIVYARDLGERNAELIRDLPGRRLYRWDHDKFALVPLGPDGVTERAAPDDELRPQP